ncbi:dynein axonemal heavy chain 5-like isoform X2 [Eriocheir sinensis]|uniref:dynein axonemal heavy chain 5-like isoform X2 n=1 Tax=Eriocheir sinensis TaxID=95602 RepID=UPI0021CA8280|nr:dynein axonemal heavy chain 5-like isoform X2 [Eriocheir sinensis]
MQRLRTTTSMKPVAIGAEFIRRKRREEQERRARRGDTDPRYEYIFQVLAACAGIARHQVMDHVFEENLLEEISKFLMPGQYNNMIWFYQECEIPPEEKGGQDEEEDGDAKSPTSPLLSQPSSGHSRRNSEVSGPTEQQPSRRNSTATQHTEDGEAAAEPEMPGRRMRLFVGNPRTTPLRGVCVCMTRTNPQRSVTEENVHREVNFMLLRAGDDPSVLLRSVNRLLGRVFVPAVRTNPSDLDTAPGSGSARDHLLAGLRSFASSLHVSESILEERVVLAKGDEGAEEVRGLSEAQAALTQPDQVLAVERTVVTWLKQIESVLIEMEQLRQETDDAGPQDELEYWKRRMAKFKFLSEQMESPQVRGAILVLQLARSKVLKVWKETDARVTHNLAEAKDNVKFVYAIEEYCHPLYLNDPPGMTPYIMMLFNTVRMIHSISKYYNTSDKLSALLIKITNQMIRACQVYISRQGTASIWSQPRSDVRVKIQHCLKLHATYRSAYQKTKEKLEAMPGERPFSFSEQYVFGKFEAFCCRLNNITGLFDDIDKFSGFFEGRAESLLPMETGLRDILKSWQEMCNEISQKSYDYLDYRDHHFDTDLEVFAASVRELLRRIHIMVEKEHEEIWETPMAYKMLARFEKIAVVVPQLDVEGKYRRILARFHQELEKVSRIYCRQCESPPQLRGLPPVAGKIQWARSLFLHLEEPMMFFKDHPVLLKMPEGKEAVKKYNRIGRMLVQYELAYYDAWRKQSMNDIQKSLRCTLVVRRPDTEELYVNWDPRISTLLHEATKIQQLGFDVPYMTQLLLNRAPLLLKKRDMVKHLLNEHIRVLGKVSKSLTPLLVPHVTKLKEALDPLQTSLTWSSIQAHSYFDQVFQAVRAFEVLIDRVNDIFHHRMEGVLAAMSSVKLYVLPDTAPWMLDLFVHNTWLTCCQAAQELNSRSRVVEDAVLELIELVLVGVEGGGQGDQGSYSFLTADDLDDATDLDDSRSVSSGGGSSRRSPVPAAEGPFAATLELPSKTLTPQEKAARKKREMREKVEVAARDLRRAYHRRVLDVLIKSVKGALDSIRRHTSINNPRGQGDTPGRGRGPIQPENPGVALVELSASLVSPGVQVTPSLSEVQEAINKVAKIILSTAMGVSQWVRCRKEDAGEPLRKNEGTAGSRKGWKIREEVLEVPAMPKNYYTHVYESKDVSKIMSQMANSFQSTKNELHNTFSTWDKYHHLWRVDKETAIREFIASTPTLQDYDRTLRSYVLLDKQIKSEPSRYRVGALAVNTDQLKKALVVEASLWVDKYGEALKTTYMKEMERLFAQLTELSRRLERPLKDLDDIKGAIDILRKTRDLELDMDDAIDPIEESFGLLVKYELGLSQEEAERVDNLRFTWQKVLAQAVEVQNLLSRVQPYFRNELIHNVAQFKKDCSKFVHDYRGTGPMVPGLDPRDASDRLIIAQNRFDTLWRKHSSYSVGEELFRLPRSEFPELAQIRKELNLLQKLYKLYNDVIDRVTSYYDIPWGEVNIEEINNELMEFQNRCRKLPKGLKEWPAFNTLKKTIDDFNDMCPLLELMSNKAMKPRHWQRIAEVISRPLEVDSENFCLRNIMDTPLLQFKEDIEDICISAVKEKDIEAKLRIVTNEWANHDLTFSTFKNRGELLLRGDTTAEVITQLEDSLMVLGSLLSNRYNAPFRKQIQKWVSDLSNTNEILERWLFVQNLWVYLEAVFVGGDIAKQLPKEAKRFYVIDKNWQKIMARAHDNPNVVTCCVGDDMLKQLLPYLQDQLEVCQKSLSGYLEKKRMMFPRFFFVSDPALLEILGQASDSHTIQSHLLSIFDNTKTVRFHEQDYDRITAISSSEGEVVQLEKPVRAEGSVEVWLMKLLSMCQQSVHGIIRQAHHVIQDPDLNVLRFLEQFPAQVGILGLQMIWTRDSEMALTQARADRRVMADMNNRFLDLLNLLINQTTRDLEPVQRTKYETLITIHIHQRDIFDSMCRNNVRSVMDFDWLRQIRIYFREDLDKTNIVLTDVTFQYQNEFVGCTERLVITPLTDRCYITLAQALSMSMGGCPTGPAGTGKTETTKDMGKTLGKYVVVFNCSDQMDYRGLGRIFKGLAQSGSWGCFDEFNRIELPVLSVAAQQIAVVHTCKKERRKAFHFTDGDVIPMSTEFGIFLTMNLGYHGRQVLPENLKIQFRNVAMMVPDRQIIIRVKLASCGFLENITLARKFFTLYKLCEEQLTKQVHYDFGLRNILSVLRTLGASKRANPKDSESTIVMRVLRDMNLSKLVDEDEPLFMSLIDDLFPNMVQEKGYHNQLTTAIGEVVNELGLINHPPWTLKLIQLYETQRVRHGMMTLGPSGAGKTSCIHVLMKALSRIGLPHRELRMNPKAITSAQMFGRLDVATNDWTDGIFSTLWRKTLKAKKGEHVWLVLDGPVDAIWIENLNSVLDDNRTLTLANGDRIPMSPTCKVIFEPSNIDNASPATVSRNGMVYMSSSGLDWQPLLQAWLRTRPHHEQGVLTELFSSTFPALFTWTKQNLRLCVPVLQVNLMAQASKVLEGLLPDEPVPQHHQRRNHDPDTEEVPQTQTAPIQEHIHRLFVFAMMWSIGALLELADRARLEDHLKNKFTALDLPECTKGPTDSIFDYRVDENGYWQHWETRVNEFIYPESGSPDYTSFLVPNVDNVRMDFLIHIIAQQGKGVLLIGEPGSAKTVTINAFMKKYNPEDHLCRNFNFSSASTPLYFQRTIESYIDKRMGSTFGPPAGKKMTVFIDDLNMPHINDWGDQPTNEIVRQTMEMGGFYSLEKPGDFTNIVDLQFLAAMGHPGGGRNDIPARLKRHFCILNSTIPSESSINKIFGVIARGHFSTKRGFNNEVRGLVDLLVPLTRRLWSHTKNKLLPTPAKFHYVFNLRDLSRIWQGMLGAAPNVVTSSDTLMALWRHECCRVISDRFTSLKDVKWFEESLVNLAQQDLGPQVTKKITHTNYFVDFLRDAPEPTGDEGEDLDMEMPKVYEPIPSFSALEDRLQMFLSQYNEMVRGAGMDLVFFTDAMIHLTRISRIIRNPGGNALLVGVGGSGKQSLTKLASFIAGYKTFQIALTRSYNTANLLEDLKVLYRTCGIQGKGTTFIFTDQEVKEEAFLEYLNNVLSSGMVSNLFNRDEQGEIVSELIPVMKREHPRRPPTPENVMDFFLTRTRQNLHVVLCFSPVGEKFRTRAMKFPGLISGCTIDWFQPWPKEALVAVAQHFLESYEIISTSEVKTGLVKGMGTIHDHVAQLCNDYFQRYRRAAHVTPKSFLSFISIYKKIYNEKREEIGESATRMTSGLDKLQEASVAVERLREELSVMEAELAVASEKAQKILEVVTRRAEEAETIKEEVEKVRDKAQALVNDIAKDKSLAEEKLEAARPALEEAEAALNTIKPAHIATIRKLGRPPHLIMRIMDCVLLLFQRHVQPVKPDPIVPCPKPSWSDSLKMMASTTFLLSLQNFPKDSINDEVTELLEPYFDMEDYDMDTAKRVCGDVAGLLSWTRAMAVFFGVNKEVLPLKSNLALQEARLRLAMGDLERAQAVLDDKQRELDVVRGQYQTALAEKQKLIDAANVCRRKMQAAATLINGLAGEKVRWTKQSKSLRQQLGRLVGDVLLTTAFLSYAGPFNQEYRTKMIKMWRSLFHTRSIPYTTDLDITSWLIDNATVSEWNLQGLPNDELSIQNGLIVSKASCYPLLIDPQGQGKIWIKNREAMNELQITSLNHKYFRTHLEDSLSLGRPLLIEDVEEELDPVLDNLLDRNFIKSGSILKVVVGDKECDIMPGFMLYITTKLPNPAYTPEVSAKTAIIDFTVTVHGLEDQLLGRVIRTEKSDLESERVALIEEVMENKRRMKELEDNLLFRLTSVQGSLVDDEDLIMVLQDTKSTAQDVSTKLHVASETERKINGAREEYRPVATRGSILYFLITDMAVVSCMYQTSLRQFLILFDMSMIKSDRSNNPKVRIGNIIRFLTVTVWRNACRGFYERHKFLFTLLLAMKIDLQCGHISHEEFMKFIKGGASLDLKAVQPKPFRWVLDITWLNLVELSKLQQFNSLLDQITENEKDWRLWFEKDKPEEEELPCGYSRSLDMFRQLLLIRSWCPDRTLSQARRYIRSALGEQYADSVILDLESTWEESDNRTPLICFLSQGSDPSVQIETLAKAKEIELRCLSMGQGQESHARRLLSEAMAGGKWLLLQNCHLSLEFCQEMLDTVTESSNVHKCFRLWLTTEVHMSFPIGLLQISIKFTNEPPQGIRASLKRTYADVSQDLLDYSNAHQWPRLLYSTAFLHTVVLERRKYGALGWNVPYEFNQADFQASVQFIQNHLDDMDPKKGVSWVTICYMLGEIQYGGRVTEDFDKRLLLTFLHVWFNERLLTSDFRFYQGYALPMCKNQAEYLEFINQLPVTDSPEVFGLHPNADITYQINTAKGILDTILSMQPKEGGQRGGETREVVVSKLANDMLSKLPADYIQHEIREALQRMGAILPMNIFLRQELDRMQKVLKVVRKTLQDLHLAIEGTIIMSTSLKDMLDAMYDARVPERWRKVSWESSTLGFWFTELMERDSQFRRWYSYGRPKAFWITGFFNPQGFLTAMRQEVTRQHKGWSLDCVILQNLVTRFNKEDIHDPPPEGVYIYGLFLEGASWDRKQGRLMESRAKILYEPMPIIYLYAVNTTSGKDPTLYECPIYRKPQRTDATYIGSIDLETTEYLPSHWTLRGVALLCDIK